MHAHVSQLMINLHKISNNLNIATSLHEVAYDTAMQAQQQHHNLLER